MPYKNIEDRIKRSREYHKIKKERICAYVKEWAKKNPEKVREYSRRNYEKHKEYSALWHKNNYLVNRDSILEKNKAYRRRSSDNEKCRRLRRKYEITLEFFNEQLKMQEGKCLCCSVKFNEKLKPNVDHCHETGSFRGIICRHCNILEGLMRRMKKEEARIELVKEYLRKVYLKTL